jgi:type I restriction enzyme S subunit
MRDPKKQWKMTTLGAHVEVQTGYPFRSQRYTDSPTGVRLLRGDNIVQGCLRWDGVKRWPSDDVEDYTKYFLSIGDVVVAMDRPWIEAGLKYAWIGEPDLPCLLVQRVARLRGTNGLSTSFLRYLIGLKAFTDYVKGIWTGVAVPHISESQIKAFPITLPPSVVQDQIVNVLRAYDDLIENNARRIKILEDMTNMIFREWFVKFRFRGHAEIPLNKTKAETLPEGWSLTSVGHVSTNFDSKRKPLSSLERAKRKGPYPYYGAAKIFDYIDDYIFDGLYLLVAEDGSVVTTERKPVLQLTDGKFWPNNHTHVLQGKPPISTYYLYLSLIDIDVSGYVTGTAQPKITQANLNRMPVILPPEPLLLDFDKTICPLFEQVAVLNRKNKVLRQTRDWLLPKLTSGEISIEHLETEPARQIS